MNNSIIGNFGQTFVKLLFFLIVSLLIIIYYWSVKTSQQYRDFISFEETILYPKFDELNYSIYQSLPLPDEAQEIEKYNSGGIPQHERELVFHYKYSGGSQNITSFYMDFLIQNNWEFYHSFDDTDNISLFFHKAQHVLTFIYLEKLANTI